MSESQILNPVVKQRSRVCWVLHSVVVTKATYQRRHLIGSVRFQRVSQFRVVMVGSMAAGVAENIHMSHKLQAW